MGQCWCHTAMACWLAGPWRASAGAAQRWRLECQRAGGDCAARVEAVALRLPCSRALRKNGSLTLYTRAGEIVFLDSPAAALHRYLGVRGGSGDHLVWRRGRFGDDFLVVSHDTGALSAFGDLVQVVAQPSAVHSSGQAPSSASTVDGAAVTTESGSITCNTSSCRRDAWRHWQPRS